MTEGPGNFWILPRLIDFQKTYRKITVDLRCAMEQADVARLESDIAIQLEPPTNPDLIVAKLGRLHIYPFVSEGYQKLYGVPSTLAELKNHRIVKQNAPQVDDSAYARILGLSSLEGMVGIKTNSRIGVLYAVERGAGVGFPADVVDRARRAARRRRYRRQPPRRPLAHLSQGVPQLRAPQDRHRLAEEDIRSQDLSLFPGRVHPSQRARADDGGGKSQFRSARIRRRQPELSGPPALRYHLNSTLGVP